MEPNEAGPSSPKISNPQPETPTTKTRRRSWFGFGPASPVVSSPLSEGAGALSPRRKSAANDEVHEMVSRSPLAPSQSRHAGDMGKGKGKAQGGDEAEEEVLTIDGQLDLGLSDSVKRKTGKRRSKGGDAEEGEVVRMENLQYRRASNRSTATVRPDPVRVDSDDPPEPPDKSEDDVSPQPGPRRRLPLSPRLSSLTDPFALHGAPPIAPSDKSTPALPTDRPLPALPPITVPPSGSELLPPTDIVITPSSPRKRRESPDRSASDRSTGLGRSPISTPDLRAERRASAGLLDPVSDRMVAGSGSGSGSSSRSSSVSGKTISRKSSQIGLGLPGRFKSSQDDTPPPLPSKTQSVSSPHTSRSTSPVPKISFTEPEITEAKEGGAVRGRPHTRDGAGERSSSKKVKRAASLSGLFSRAATISTGPSSPMPEALQPKDTPAASASAAGNGTQVELPAGGDASGPPVSESSTSPSGTISTPAQAETGKMAVMLEWLGMRKSSKRRASEAIGMKSEASAGDNKAVQGAEGEKRSPPNAAVLQGVPNGPAERRPSSSKTTTAINEPKEQSPLTAADSEKGNDAPQRVSHPIPILTLRPTVSTSTLSIPLTAESAEASPTFFHPRSEHVASPTSDGEEILFTAPGAPWTSGASSFTDGSSRAASPLGRTPPVSGLQMTPQLEGVTRKDSRNRSRSDAPAPSPKLLLSLAGDAQRHHRPPSHQAATPSSGSTPNSPLLPPVRPKLGARTNSANSAIMDKVKNVFSKSARQRDRSRSLLPGDRSQRPGAAGNGGGSEANEFGGLPGRSRAGTMSTASLSSTTGARPASPAPGSGPNASLLDLNVGNRKVFLNDDTPEQTPRSSIAIGSTSSQTTPASSSMAAAEPSTVPPAASTSARAVPMGSASGPHNRKRASTVSFASSAPLTSAIQPFLHPGSPSLFPAPGPSAASSASSASGTHTPKRRPSAIHRFSSGLLGSAPSSPKGPGPLFPLPPRSSGSTFSSAQTNLGMEDTTLSNSATSILMSPGTSPRPSTGSLPPRGNEAAVKALVKRLEDETPAAWLGRVKALVGREDIAGVLAASAHDFHTEALRLYMMQFNFTHNALDVALRRLLMHMSLPKETQQIDRVIEAFAVRYEACEPGLFGSKDNTYVLAFSMMMLHTDAFNKHNKNKMTKPDYVRNTRLDGVAPAILEYFYDNITYTPFQYVEDDLAPLAPASGSVHTPGSASGLSSAGRSRSGSDAISPAPSPGTALISSGRGTPTTPATITSLGLATPRSVTSGNKVDVYSLIRTDQVGSLRVDVERLIPPESPFSCTGGGAKGDNMTVDMEVNAGMKWSDAHDKFVNAALLKLGGRAHSPGKRRLGRRKGSVSGAESEVEAEVVLRITKVGLLSRRDDTSAITPDSLSSRKSSASASARKWRSWSVVLTGSQLLFFKDPFWALTLQQQIRSAAARPDERGQVVVSRQGRCVPDEVFPMKDAVAVYDRDLTGANPFTFRFNLPHRSYLLEAPSEAEMIQWITLINYSATFKTAGIRMRAGTMMRDQAVLAGKAAATSFKREAQQAQTREMGRGRASPKTGAKKTFGYASSGGEAGSTDDREGPGDDSRRVNGHGNIHAHASVEGRNGHTGLGLHAAGSGAGADSGIGLGIRTDLTRTEVPPDSNTTRNGPVDSGAPTLPAIDALEPISFPASSSSTPLTTAPHATSPTAATPSSPTPPSPILGRAVLSSLAAESVDPGLQDGSGQLGEVFHAIKAELAAAEAVSPALGQGAVEGQDGVQEGKSDGEVVSATAAASASIAAGAGGRKRVRVVSTHAASRGRLIETSIRDLSVKIAASDALLASHLLQARNLAILTPFQRTTRDRIATAAAAPLAHRVRAERMQLAKLRVWRDVLRGDVVAEREE